MIHCVLCGHDYQPVVRCPSACPLHGACHFVCCPHCGYQNIDVSKSTGAQLAQRIWNKYGKPLVKPQTDRND